MNWAAARAACFAKSTDGRVWRLPRLSELRMMYLNGAALVASGNGFNQIMGDYWSSSEAYDPNNWFIRFNDSTTATTPNTDHLRVRCIREII